METNQQTATTTAVATVPPPKPPVLAGERGLQLRSLDDYWRMAQCVSSSGLAPKGLEKPEAALIAMQLGAEIGLPPLASLQQIAVINGRPSIYGDAQLGVVRGTGELERFDEWFEVTGKRVTRTPSEFTDDTQAVCLVKRRGYPETQDSFSVKDAKRAGLWGKAGPWSQYPARMLRFRARSFILRDQFGDALRGLRTVEESLDVGAIDVTAEPVKPAPVFVLGAAPKTTTTEHDAPTAPLATECPPTSTAEPAASSEPTATAPAVELPPEPEQTPQQQLADLVQQAGHDFTRFVQWGKAAGQWGTKDAPKSWAQVPYDRAEALLKARNGLLKQLAMGT
jgi:hypothetical protein